MKKKIVILLVLGVFLVGLSTASSPLKQNTTPTIQVREENNRDISSLPTDYPEWADGGFVGAWGKGKDDILGYFKGVYGQKGRVPIFVGAWNTSDGDKTGIVQGIFGKGYILGKINLKGEKTPVQFVGLYKATNTKFIARIMGIKGFPMIVAGQFKPLKE
jgi:hypothetical protein